MSSFILNARVSFNLVNYVFKFAIFIFYRIVFFIFSMFSNSITSKINSNSYKLLSSAIYYCKLSISSIYRMDELNSSHPASSTSASGSSPKEHGTLLIYEFFENEFVSDSRNFRKLILSSCFFIRHIGSLFTLLCSPKNLLSNFIFYSSSVTILPSTPSLFYLNSILISLKFILKLGFIYKISAKIFLKP